jgi:membrane-associated phospholipid phosphatase
MLDTSFVVWLQHWASPPLTDIMQAVSLWGYVPGCLAIAIVWGFGRRLELGVTLILAIVLADAMTIAAKGAFASPRPHAVDARIHTFGAFEVDLPPMAAGTPVPADDFGFPSGHVATTAAWALGLASRRRTWWQIGMAATWIALMALSRMYLGRHFPADVVGGLVVGAVALALAHVLHPVAGTGSRLTAGNRTTLGATIIVAVAVAALSGFGLSAHDAGRFCGLAGASLVLIRSPALDDVVSPAARMLRVAVALVLLGVALWSNTWTITAAPRLVGVTTLIINAALHAAVLLVPLALGRSQP